MKENKRKEMKSRVHRPVSRGKSGLDYIIENVSESPNSKKVAIYEVN